MVRPWAVVTVFSPAKINLFLAVTGRRTDGFHDLVSVAAPLDFGDELHATICPPGDGAQYTLACDDPAVPLDGSNLVLKAAAAFAAATGSRQRIHFRLTKRIPIGAGLGGGSSNAVAALRALNQLGGGLLGTAQMEKAAAGLGSDCVLFLRDAPIVMRGRGEQVELLAEPAARRIRGRRVLLFKPSFGISTPWAYGQMVTRGTDYLPAVQAEGRLARWMGGLAPMEELLFNNMEPAAFEKYLALPLLLAKLRVTTGVAAAMSGSGSACFALLPEQKEAAGRKPGADTLEQLKCHLRIWGGAEIYLQEAQLA
jgi:4-diphosphocytidyl-2-C-methyl-D-erythritol kinase